MSSLDDRPPPPPPPPTGHPGPAPQGRGGPGVATPAAPPGGRPAIPPPRRLGRRSPAPVSSSPGGLPTRRRWGRFAAGVTLALLGAWVFAALYVSAGERVEVVALARDVPMFQEIEEDDLRTVRVAADPSVDTISAGRMDDLVGRVAAVQLTKDTLLSGDQLLKADVDVPRPGEIIVTAEVAPAQAGPSALVPGRAVLVNIVTGPQDEPVGAVDATMFSVGEPDDNTGKRQVEFIVTRTDFEVVSTPASEGRISLGLREQAED